MKTFLNNRTLYVKFELEKNSKNATILRKNIITQLLPLLGFRKLKNIYEPLKSVSSTGTKPKNEEEDDCPQKTANFWLKKQFPTGFEPRVLVDLSMCYTYVRCAV